MKKQGIWKKWMMFSLACMLVLACAAPALAAEEDQIRYTYETGTVTSDEGNTISWTIANYGTDEDNAVRGVFISGAGSIPDYAPEYCTTYNWKSTPPWWGSNSTGKSAAHLFVRSGITSIGTYAFCSMIILDTAELPDGLTEIGDYAFSGDSVLSKVVIPDSVTSIGENAFANCSKVVLYCSSGSYAAQYASAHDLETHYTDICSHDSWEWVVTKAADCTNSGTSEKRCSDCQEVLATKTVAATGHSYGSWKTTSEATVLNAKVQKRTCSVCGDAETRTVGDKLTPTIKVNANSLLLKVKQSTTALKVSGLAKGDYVEAYVSADTEIASVTEKGKITAGSKTGSTKITIRLASGKTKQVTVKVQKSAVAVKKIRGVSSKLTLEKGKTKTLKPQLLPITCAQKITYKSSNKSVATVNSKGKITAKKKGTAIITVKAGKKTVKCKVTVK